MVKIRLTRTGKKHQPHYRIVAIDSAAPRDSEYIERIGYYNPRTKPPTLKYDKELLEKWIKNGAQMTDTVHDIFVREGVIEQTDKRVAVIKAKIQASKKRNEPEEEEEEKTEENDKEDKEEKSDEKEKKEDKKKTGDKDKEDKQSEEEEPDKKEKEKKDDKKSTKDKEDKKSDGKGE